jgi:hypothetical protein
VSVTAQERKDSNSIAEAPFLISSCWVVPKQIAGGRIYIAPWKAGSEFLIKSLEVHMSAFRRVCEVISQAGLRFIYKCRQRRCYGVVRYDAQRNAPVNPAKYSGCCGLY